MPAEEFASVRAIKEERAVYNVETGVVKEDGKVVWTSVSAVPVAFPDWKIVIVTSDITERKRAEEALRESEERFRRLAEAPFEGIVFHEEGNIIDANEAFATMFGYSLSEVIGKNALDFAAPELRELALGHIRDGSEELYDGVATRKDGSTFFVEVRGKNIPYKGRTIRLTAVRDITEHKRDEAALRESEERLRLTLEAAGVVAWEQDLVSGALREVGPVAAVFGEPAGSRHADQAAFLQRIHPEDRERVSAALEAGAHGEDSYAIEFRVPLQDGSVRWIVTTGSSNVTRKANQSVHGALAGTSPSAGGRRRRCGKVKSASARSSKKQLWG
jgi:PAS domain S-box-containing protein